jgi:hypothetical protein
VNSGLPADRFTFEGFLPDKKGRQTRLQQLAEEQRTMIFYVSPHKLLKTLADFITTFGADRKASLSRELTKLHEETLRGTLGDLQLAYTDKIIKGEMVLVVAGKK